MWAHVGEGEKMGAGGESCWGVRRLAARLARRAVLAGASRPILATPAPWGVAGERGSWTRLGAMA